MKIKTSELTGERLTYALLVAEGLAVYTDLEKFKHRKTGVWLGDYDYRDMAMDIIEREDISLRAPDSTRKHWEAVRTFIYAESIGATASIAAMRCHVAAKLGDKVDVPDTLVG